MAHLAPAAIELVEADCLLLDGGIQANRHDHEAERQRAGPDCGRHPSPFPNRNANRQHPPVSGTIVLGQTQVWGACGLLRAFGSRLSAGAAGRARAAGWSGAGRSTYFESTQTRAALLPTWSRSAARARRAEPMSSRPSSAPAASETASSPRTT